MVSMQMDRKPCVSRSHLYVSGWKWSNSRQFILRYFLFLFKNKHQSSRMLNYSFFAHQPYIWSWKAFGLFNQTIIWKGLIRWWWQQFLKHGSSQKRNKNLAPGQRTNLTGYKVAVCVYSQSFHFCLHFSFLLLLVFRMRTLKIYYCFKIVGFDSIKNEIVPIDWCWPQ